MRKTFLYWFLGLVFVGSIAGCGALRNSREKGSSAGSSGSAPAKWSTCQAPQPGATSANAQNMQGQSGVAWFEIVEKPAPFLPRATVPAPQRPETAPASPPLIKAYAGSAVPISEIKEYKNAQPIPKTAAPADRTAPQVAPEKAKTAGFQSLTGQVQQFRNTWRLRYAAIDQEDPYGGVVVLDGGAELSQLRDGQRVRVSGVLIPPESRTGSAHYRVKTIEMLD
jgi:hypothetical protein